MNDHDDETARSATQSNHHVPQEPVRLTFFGGGYVIVLTLLLAGVLLAWGLWPAFTRPRKPGDGVDPATYQFDLTHARIPVDEIVPAMIQRDMIPFMEKAVILDGRSLAPEVVADDRKKLLVSSDRVIGVTINGESRAYPVSVLNVHEIINDTLGNVPIAVTYHWPSDGAQVFDRRIGDETVTFAASGLLYNGNLLMYRRNASKTDERGEPTMPIGGEPLYSQLMAQAVTGADAESGVVLSIVPHQLTSWGKWITDHPDSTVAGRDPSYLAKRYEKGDPGEHRISDHIRFPPRTMPPADSWAPKTPVVIVEINGAQRVYPLAWVRQNLDERGEAHSEVGGTPIVLTYDHASQTAEVVTIDREIPILHHAYWYAWHAMYPDADIIQ